MRCLLSVLSLNAGLLRIVGPGWFDPAPFVDERARSIPEPVSRLGADVVMLQEVHRRGHRDRLRAAFSSTHPHATHASGALLTLSRWPLTSTWAAFDEMLLEERVVAPKGMLMTTLLLPWQTSLTLINVHTTAGGLRHHPESPAMDRLRHRQLEQLLAVAQRERVRGIAIIGGDLNTGPGVSDDNYRLLGKAGFVDVYERLHPGSRSPTWDPKNPLNVNGPHRQCPPQRIDHFLIHGDDLERCWPRRCEIVLGEPIVPTAREPVSLSDHSGVLATFELSEPSAPRWDAQLQQR